jgi:hypothetical protein
MLIVLAPGLLKHPGRGTLNPSYKGMSSRPSHSKAGDLPFIYVTTYFILAVFIMSIYAGSARRPIQDNMRREFGIAGMGGASGVIGLPSEGLNGHRWKQLWT